MLTSSSRFLVSVLSKNLLTSESSLLLFPAADDMEMHDLRPLVKHLSCTTVPSIASEASRSAVLIGFVDMTLEVR